MQIRGAWSAGPGDDQARFLADLRALRGSAAIGYDEMAARAHYPSYVLKEAENGPSLPGLPILTAYVRACEGNVLDWEERWRRLNPDVAEDPNLPVRPAGASAAAVAGARAGVSIAPPDVYDPERIKAALRGNQGHPEQIGHRVSAPRVHVPAPAAGPAEEDQHAESGAARAAGSGWGTLADTGVMSANGSHLADYGGRGPFEAALPGNSDSAERVKPGQAEEFSWLKKNTPEPRPVDGEPAWREQPQSGSGRSERDAGLSPVPAPGQAAPGQATPGHATPGQATPGQATPEQAATEQAPWRQADGRTSPDLTDFWGKPVGSITSDPLRPGGAPRAHEPAIARASWSAPADMATESTHQAVADAAALSGASGVAGAAQPNSPAGSTTQTAVGDQDGGRKDRLFPVRLLVVIVIAALIGSVLVLLLK